MTLSSPRMDYSQILNGVQFLTVNELINKYIQYSYLHSPTYVFMTLYLGMHHFLPLFIKWGHLTDNWNRSQNCEDY
jgi:hypothetical protein